MNLTASAATNNELLLITLSNQMFLKKQNFLYCLLFVASCANKLGGTRFVFLKIVRCKALAGKPLGHFYQNSEACSEVAETKIFALQIKTDAHYTN